jgi:hypothetical protein
VSDDPIESRADLEIAGEWRASSARWQTRGRRRTEILGDLETEELSEREGAPQAPRPGRTYRDVAGRWRFSAWLRDRMPRP